MSNQYQALRKLVREIQKENTDLDPPKSFTTEDLQDFLEKFNDQKESYKRVKVRAVEELRLKERNYDWQPKWFQNPKDDWIKKFEHYPRIKYGDQLGLWNLFIVYKMRAALDPKDLHSSFILFEQKFELLNGWFGAFKTEGIANKNIASEYQHYMPEILSLLMQGTRLPQEILNKLISMHEMNKLSRLIQPKPKLSIKEVKIEVEKLEKGLKNLEKQLVTATDESEYNQQKGLLWVGTPEYINKKLAMLFFANLFKMSGYVIQDDLLLQLQYLKTLPATSIVQLKCNLSSQKDKMQNKLQHLKDHNSYPDEIENKSNNEILSFVQNIQKRMVNNDACREATNFIMNFEGDVSKIDWYGIIRNKDQLPQCQSAIYGILETDRDSQVAKEGELKACKTKTEQNNNYGSFHPPSYNQSEQNNNQQPKFH